MVDRARDEKGRFVASSEKRSHPTEALTKGPSEVVNAEGEFGMRALSAIVSRLQLANMAGLQYEGERDLYQVFGYKRQLTPNDFLAKYNRQDITSRIVDAPPGATWSDPPVIEEGNPVKAKWDEITKRVKLWNALHRADRLARMNPFSLLLFGFDQGTLSSQATSATELLYVRALPSRQVTEITYDTNPRSARFGQPDKYKIAFDDPSKRTATGQGASSTGIKDLIVHHSRVVHLTDTSLEDPNFGTPIVERVYNLLDDLLKTAGGTAETYWLTSNRGMQADIDKEMNIDPADAAALSDEIEEYQHQLRRVIRTRGVDLKVLDSNTPNPKETFEMIMALISGTSGIPRRILLGSEAGQLASEQDRANWAERIEERRKLYANPWILNPTLELLQRVGLVPEGEVEWVWPSAFIQNPLEEGQTMAQMARAAGNLSRQTGNQTPMPITDQDEARAILGLPPMTEEQRASVAEFMATPERDDGSEDEEDTDERRQGEEEDENRTR